MAGGDLRRQRAPLRPPVGRRRLRAGAGRRRRRLRVRHLQRPPLPPRLLPLRHGRAVEARPGVGEEVYAAGLRHDRRLHEPLQEDRLELPYAALLRPVEAALVGRRADGVRRREEPGEHQRGRERVLRGGATGDELRRRPPRRRGVDAGGAGDRRRRDLVAREGGGGHVRGGVQQAEPGGGGAVGQQERRRPLVRATGVEGVQAGDPGSAIVAHHGAPVQRRGVREGAGEVGVSGAGEGRRGRRMEGLRLRSGGGLRRGGGAEEDQSAVPVRRRELPLEYALVALQQKRWEPRQRLPVQSLSPVMIL